MEQNSPEWWKIWGGKMKQTHRLCFSRHLLFCFYLLLPPCASLPQLSITIIISLNESSIKVEKTRKNKVPKPEFKLCNIPSYGQPLND